MRHLFYPPPGMLETDDLTLADQGDSSRLLATYWNQASRFRGRINSELSPVMRRVADSVERDREREPAEGPHPLLDAAREVLGGEPADGQVSATGVGDLDQAVPTHEHDQPLGGIVVDVEPPT